jgi:soluble lytic murein transglycosylase
VKKYIKAFICLLLTAAILYGGVFAFNKIQKAIYPIKYSDIVNKYSEQYNVEPSLIYAVIKCESSFKPESVSHIGARGLMQITPDTFDWLKSKTGEHNYDTDDLFIPEVNIKYGTYLLSLNLDKFSNTVAALAAYHAGRSIVESWLLDDEKSSDGKNLHFIPYKDTENYVKRVISVQKTYNKLYY